MNDTIFALSSGSPPAALAIVRMSGPAARAAAAALGAPPFVPRRAMLVRLIDPAAGGLLDEAILLAFAAPRSATGEDVVELHLHGGRATVRAVEAALADLPGLRRAEPGEFTRRALANGRLGLNEAEALADLLAAETESQRRAAIGRLDGALDRAMAGWRTRLLAIAAAGEAALDHDEEGDSALADVTDAQMRGDLAMLARDIGQWRAAPSVERLRDGVRVVLGGPPNAGKSSLFNALCGDDAAIVDAEAGTTRDIIERPSAIDGVPIVLVDTAGLRGDAQSPVEAIGIDRARRAGAQADVLLWLGRAADAPPGALLLCAKADLGPDGPGLRVSARTGEGLDALRRAIVERAAAMLPREDEVAINDRQRACVGEIEAHLRHALDCDDPLMRAEDIRLARVALDRLTGTAGVEDLLDTLFARFCIGK